MNRTIIIISIIIIFVIGAFNHKTQNMSDESYAAIAIDLLNILFFKYSALMLWPS
jgi:hypothetical protein